ncbi:MAG: hypothetical protein SYR96_01020 [Actinomycetota bacterium]|nr:hypothetical protein [Actinomycetota bacterium]
MTVGRVAPPPARKTVGTAVAGMVLLGEPARPGPPRRSGNREEMRDESALNPRLMPAECRLKPVRAR